MSGSWSWQGLWKKTERPKFVGRFFYFDKSSLFSTKVSTRYIEKHNKEYGFLKGVTVITMEITHIAKHRLIVIRVYGEIDHHTASETRRVADRELKRTGAVNIAFDFGHVTFMDSAGIGMIIGRYKIVSALGGRLMLFDISDHVQRLLEMAGLRGLVIISDTLSHGIAEMNGTCETGRERIYNG